MDEVRTTAAVQHYLDLLNNDAPAGQHMRWELNDLARRLDEQPATVELCDGLVRAPVSSGSGLTENSRRMLKAIGDLPEGEREAFDLVRIHGMTQAEAARLLGVSAVTVKRRLNRSLQLLTEALSDLRPTEPAPKPEDSHPLKTPSGQET